MIILLISWILTQEGLTLSQNNGFLCNLDLFHLENRLLPGMFPHIQDLCSECKSWNTETFWRFEIRINWMLTCSSSSTAQNPNWSGKCTLRGTPGTRRKDWMAEMFKFIYICCIYDGCPTDCFILFSFLFFFISRGKEEEVHFNPGLRTFSDKGVVSSNCRVGRKRWSGPMATWKTINCAASLPPIIGMAALEEY